MMMMKVKYEMCVHAFGVNMCGNIFFRTNSLSFQ